MAKRLKKAMFVNSELANCIFEKRNVEAEGDLIIPREQIKTILDMSTTEDEHKVDAIFKEWAKAFKGYGVEAENSERDTQ